MTDMRDASMVLTTKDVILEIRGDLKQVASDVAGIKIEQARVAVHLQAEQNIGTDRRQRMSEVQIGINTRLAAHDVEIGELKLEKKARMSIRATLSATANKSLAGTMEVGIPESVAELVST